MNFLKYKWLYFLISGLVIGTGIVAMILWRFNLSIDFTGGSLLEYSFQQPASPDQIRSIIEDKTKLQVVSIQPSQQNRVIIKLNDIKQEQADQIRKALSDATGQSVSELQFETLGPTLGRELLIKTLWAIILATSFILGYIAWTFKNVKFGVSATIATIHDILVLIGSFAILGHFYGLEVDTLFVTAVLTTVSFSIHDTVVVYDRIREGQHQYPKASFTDITNKALTETITRSLNNSFTIIFMLAALALLGGSSIRGFATALLIGTISGAYSSPFVAVPILDSWYKWEQRRKISPSKKK